MSGTGSGPDYMEALRRLAMDRAERAASAERAREYALRFDRGVVLDRILEQVDAARWAPVPA